MKKFVSVLLVLALALTPLVSAADLFPAVNTYSGFADVAQGQWYTDAVKTCVEAGLMNGTGSGNFTPEGTMTVAEAATIAARILSAVNGQAIPAAAAGQTWYAPYVSYLTAAGVAVATPTQTATRDQFFSYLAAVVPASELPAINAITSLPDTSDANVLAFYNAGILTGVDAYGTFHAAGTLSRAECATMVARIIRPALRQTFTPAEKTQAPQMSYEEELNSTMALMVNGRVFTMQEFVSEMDWLIFEQDRSVYNYTGQRLNWNADYGVGDLPVYFLNLTMDTLVERALKEQQAKAFGTTVDNLAQTLTPSPSREVLSAYAQGMDYLAAKHILIQTYDPSTGAVKKGDSEANNLAQQIIDALNANPSMTQFDNLLTMFNDDPGMNSYPEGYLFQSGEMVAEFEQATRDLEFYNYTRTPVKSAYGYHVILRLDPADLTELRETYQNSVLNSLLDTWVDESTVTVNYATLESLNVPACYQQFLNSLSAAQGG